MPKAKTMKTVVIVIAVIITLVILWPFTMVTAGHTGVRINLGSVDPIPLNEGFHFKIPLIQNIYIMDNRIQKYEADCGAASSDLQTIHSKIAVNYRVNPSQSAALYKNVGSGFADRILSPAIQESVKAITAKHTAEELITKRQDASTEMRDLLTAKVKDYGLVIDNFNIISFDFSEEFNKAIEAKQTAQQQALKAEQDLSRIKIEAEQKIAQAKAEAESLRLQKQEITKELLDLRRIEAIKEKWDGKLPSTVYISGSSTDATVLGIPIK